MAEFLDNHSRKVILLKWIPRCLFFLHIWATTLVVSASFFDKDNETIMSMFDACSWGIAGLVLLLISDRALEFIITRFTGTPQVVEKTVTEKTVISPPENKDVQITTSGDVNVSS